MERGKARGNKSNIDSLTPRRVTLQIITDILDTVNIHSATVAIAVRADQRNIDIEAVNVSDAQTVMANLGRICQNLVNLLNNSIKFTDSGGSVCIDLHLSDTNEFDFTVLDTGVGIPPANQAKYSRAFIRKSKTS